MCLLDSSKLCYVSVLHYLSGFDPTGAKQSSSANSTLRGTEREQQPWKTMLSYIKCWVIAWDNPGFWYFLFPAVPGVLAHCSHLHSHWFWCWLPRLPSSNQISSCLRSRSGLSDNTTLTCFSRSGSNCRGGWTCEQMSCYVQKQCRADFWYANFVQLRGCQAVRV